MSTRYDRREFIKSAILLSGGLKLSGCVIQPQYTNRSFRVYPEAPRIRPEVVYQRRYSNPEASFRLGFERLAENQFDILRGKRVGLICNQASIDRFGSHTRVLLQRHPAVNLTSLYAPEHGIDGTQLAGKKVPSAIDPVTGLIVHSLYDKTRKPTREQLSNVDVLLYDLQDIGIRSYTYMSTLLRCMQACSELNKELIVLDRPNPLGGLRIEGPPLDRKWTSFVGNAPLPYIHGMTSGELARYFFGERIVNTPNLSVVPMKGWNRKNLWHQNNLRWIATSPNIPNPISVWNYGITSFLGGATGVDVGIGTSSPFSYAGGRNINADFMYSSMFEKQITGVQYERYQRNDYSGVKMTVNPSTVGALTSIGMYALEEIARQTGGRILTDMPRKTRDLFHKVYGSDDLYNKLLAGYSAQQIMAPWGSWNASFRQKRAKYLLYR